jgi:uncharacterized membrane protein YfcA
VGLAAGLLGGLLGVGGGIVLMPVLRYGLGLPAAEAAGTCVVGVLGTTVGGALAHWRLGQIVWRSLWPVLLVGAVTSTVFSLLFPSFALRAGWLDLGIGLVFCLVAGRMILSAFGRWRRPVSATSPADSPDLPGTLPEKAAVGGAGGVFPGLLGIGTGVILVPTFILVLRAPIRTAMAASLACFLVTAAVSATFKLFQGYVAPAAALAVALGTALGAALGARLQRAVPSPALRVAFGLLFTGVALRFLHSALEVM